MINNSSQIMSYISAASCFFRGQEWIPDLNEFSLEPMKHEEEDTTKIQDSSCEEWERW